MSKHRPSARKPTNPDVLASWRQYDLLQSPVTNVELPVDHTSVRLLAEQIQLVAIYDLLGTVGRL